MKSVCLFFEVHIPVRYKTFRFFDIGQNQYYYDDFSNESTTQLVSARCLTPLNNLLAGLTDLTEGRFKFAISLSGTAMDLLETYSPDTLLTFQKLAKTGCAEYVAQTNCHSLTSLYNNELFHQQVKSYVDRIYGLTGQKPVTFCNTDLIYNDLIGTAIADAGFSVVLAEGSKQALGWKSPNFLYVNPVNPRLKVLLRNRKLSEDIAARFSSENWSQHPMTAEKFVDWVEAVNDREEVINLFLPAETFGLIHQAESGIFDFLKELILLVDHHPEMKLIAPSEITEEMQPVSAVNVPNTVSWKDEENDITPFNGNILQKEAISKLYGLAGNIANRSDPGLLKDWEFLQSADNFTAMSSNPVAGLNRLFHPEQVSPHEAFINYMNILSDFKIRIGNLS